MIELKQSCHLCFKETRTRKLRKQCFLGGLELRGGGSRGRGLGEAASDEREAGGLTLVSQNTVKLATTLHVC